MSIFNIILTVFLGITGLHGVVSGLFGLKDQPVTTKNAAFMWGLIFLMLAFVCASFGVTESNG